MPALPKTSSDEILKAALILLKSESLDALTMRRLAEFSGIRAPSLYRHFPGQDAIHQALAEHAAQQLLKRLCRTRTFDGALNAYQSFAADEPALYELLVIPADPAHNHERKKLWNHLLALVAPLTGNSDDTPSAVAVWSFLHGYCALRRSGAFGDSGPKGGFARGIAILRSGMQRSH